MKATLRVVLVSLITGTASVTAQTWSGSSDGEWTNSANWSQSTIPNSSTSEAHLSGSANTDIDISSAISLYRLYVDSGSSAFTLSGSTINIYDGASIDSGYGIRNNSASLLKINSDLVFQSRVGIRAATGDITFNGNINLNGNQVRFLSDSGRTLTLNGSISGTSTSLAFNGGGTVLVNGNSTMSATVYIWSSTVIVSVDALTTGGAFGIGTSDINLGPVGASGTYNATLLTDGAVTVARNLRVVTNGTGTNIATIGGSTSDVSTYSGTITMGSSSAVAQPLTVTAVAGGRVNITGNVIRASSATGSADTLTKTGAGIVALSGSNNTYLGTTTVSQGTLLVNGTLSSGGGDVLVSSGASLGGNGTIQRNVNLASGAILTPGDMNNYGTSSIGTLTVMGNLTLNTGSVIYMDIGELCDLIAVSGDISMGGALYINPGSGATTKSYEIFAYNGTLINQGGLDLHLAAGMSATLDYSTNGVVFLNVTAIPEPEVFTLVAIGISILLGMGISRRVPVC